MAVWKFSDNSSILEGGANQFSCHVFLVDDGFVFIQEEMQISSFKS